MEANNSSEVSEKPAPSLLKRCLRFILYSVILLIALVLLYIGLGIGLGKVPTQARDIAEAKDHTIYLETNGIHVDFIVPNDYLKDDPLLATLIQPGSTFTAIGWGDKAFYLETPQWQDLTLRNFMRALFWKSDSLMHVSPYPYRLEGWVPVHLSEGQVEELLTFIRATFVDEEGAPVIIPDVSYFGDDHFYTAHGSYTLFYTCNNWTNEGLSTIGESTALWSPFDGAILEHAQRNDEEYRHKTHTELKNDR